MIDDLINALKKEAREDADIIQALRAENATLRAEVNDLRATLRNCLTDANFMRAAAAAYKETGND